MPRQDRRLRPFLPPDALPLSQEEREANLEELSPTPRIDCDDEMPCQERHMAHKYGAIATEVDGVRFHSRAEARRYEDLKLLQAGGEIESLELQPRYPLVVNGEKVGEYRADFRYLDTTTEQWVVEDVKGASNALYRLKKKLVKALYGIDVIEIEA